MPLNPPPSAERAHENILQLLVKVQHLSGKTGKLAEDLAKGLQTHMELEERLALPLLGLLPDLTDGKPGSKTAQRASQLYTEMKKQYPNMLKGHKEISKILSRLKKVGAEEGHLTAVRFCELLAQHAKEEEEVLYPAALLAGRLAAARAKAD